MKFLVVGLGSIGLRHAKNLQAMGHEVYGCDMDNSRYEATGIEKEPNERTRYDAHIICSPTSEHARHIWNAVEVDNTHVFVEKPIADKYNGLITEALHKAKENNLIVMVGNMLRFHPKVIEARQRIDRPRRAIFKVLQRNTRPEYLRDGVLLNWGAHEIDLALHLLGPAKLREAEVSKTIATIALEHENGCRSVIQMDYVTEPEERRFTIFQDDPFTVDLRLADWNPVYMAEMRAFIERINGGENQGATGEDGLRTLEIINAAQEMTDAA